MIPALGRRSLAGTWIHLKCGRTEQLDRTSKAGFTAPRRAVPTKFGGIALASATKNRFLAT